METNKLTILKNRLSEIGIETTYTGNYPWVYLDTVSDIRVKEKFCSEHAFTIGFTQLDGGFIFTNLPKIFEIIRKYRLQ